MDFEDLIPSQNKATGNAGDRGGIGFDDLVPAKSRGRGFSVKPSRRRGTVQATGENAPRGMQNQKQAIIDYYNNSGIADLNREDAEQIFATLPEDVAGPVRDMWARDTVKSSRKENEKSTLGSIAQGVHDKAQQYLQYTPVGPFVDEITSYPNALMGADLDTELALSRAQKSAAYEGDENPLIRTPLGDIYGSGLAKVAGIPSNLLLPQAKALQGANVLSRAGNAALTGAGYAGLAAFGEGEGVADRAVNTAITAPVGAVAGGGLSLAGSGIKAGAEKAGQGLQSLYRQYIQPSIGGNLNPKATAAKNINAAIESDRAVGQSLGKDNRLMTAREFDNARQTGQPVTALELGGETTRSLARSAANNSPEAREILTRAIDKRYESQAPRIVKYLDDLTGGAGKSTDDLLDAAQKARAPLYKKAYSETQAGVLDRNLMRLEQSPVLKSAMKEADVRLADRFAAGAETAGKPPGTFTYKSGDKIYTARTLEYWDAAKQALDDKVSALYRQGKSGRAREVKNIKNRLVDILDANSPSYKGARSTAETFFKQRDAFTAGQKFISAKVSTRQASDAVKSMTGPEQELFRRGYVDAVTSKIQNVSDRRNVANMLLDSPASRAKAVAALGKERARDFVTMLHVENIMDLARSAVSGNSTTARQLVELGLVGGSASYGAYTGDAKGYAIAATLLAGRGVANAGRRKVAEEVARLLTSTDPKSYQKAIETIAKTPALSKRVRHLDKLFADKGIWKAAAVNSPKLTNSEEN